MFKYHHLTDDYAIKLGWQVRVLNRTERAGGIKGWLSGLPLAHFSIELSNMKWLSHLWSFIAKHLKGKESIISDSRQRKGKLWSSEEKQMSVFTSTLIKMILASFFSLPRNNVLWLRW